MFACHASGDRGASLVDGFRRCETELQVPYNYLHGDRNDGNPAIARPPSELFSTNFRSEYQAIEYYMCQANPELHEGEWTGLGFRVKP